MIGSAQLSMGDFLFTAVTLIVGVAVIGGFITLMIFLIKSIRRMK